MKKSYRLPLLITLCTGLFVGFQNCTQGFNSIESLNPALNMPSNFDSNSITSTSFKLQAVDGQELSEQSEVSLNFSRAEMEVQTSIESSKIPLNKEEIEQIKSILQLARPIALDAQACQSGAGQIEPMALEMANTASVQMGIYNSCSSSLDLNIEEKRALMRLVWALIRARLPRICPMQFAPPMNCPAGYQTSQIFDSKFCPGNVKCLPPPPVCPDLPILAVACAPGFMAEDVVDANGCVTGSKCVPQIATCPLLPLALPLCLEGTVLKEVRDANQCLTGFRCEPVACPAIAPLSPEVEVKCKASGGQLINRYNENKCVIGVECVKVPTCLNAPSMIPPVCPPDRILVRQTDSSGCLSGYACEILPSVGDPCPMLEVGAPTCSNTTVLQPIINESKCLIGYTCTAK